MPQATATYHVHWNGSRPFVAKITGLNYRIRNNPPDNTDVLDYSGVAKEIWLGSPDTFTEGNTILIHMKDPVDSIDEEGDNYYAFIGRDIYMFWVGRRTVDKFVSEIGNADVPYPWVKTTNNWYYLLIENISFHSDVLLTDPYAAYYDQSQSIQITCNMKNVHPINPIFLYQKHKFGHPNSFGP